MSSIERLSSKLSHKIAQSSPEDSDAFVKKTKSQLAPWFNGMSKILLNLKSYILTNKIVDNKNSIYNKMNQHSENILITINEIEKKVLFLLKNLKYENFTLNKINDFLKTFYPLMCSNPQYKPNLIFTLKLNTQYSFLDCIKSLQSILSNSLISSGKNT